MVEEERVGGKAGGGGVSESEVVGEGGVKR